MLTAGRTDPCRGVGETWGPATRSKPVRRTGALQEISSCRPETNFPVRCARRWGAVHFDSAAALPLTGAGHRAAHLADMAVHPLRARDSRR